MGTPYRDMLAHVELEARHLGTASASELASLRGLGMPATFIEFYAECCPRRSLDVGNVRLLAVEEILSENAPDTLETHFATFGLPVFACTIYGDALCFDLQHPCGATDPPVVRISHETSYEGCTRRDILKMNRRVERSFSAFIQRLSRRRWPTSADLDDADAFAKHYEAEQHQRRVRELVAQADMAFHDRDFCRVVDLLSPVQADLSPATQRKLDYARRHTDGG